MRKWIKRGLMVAVAIAVVAAIAFAMWPKPVEVETAEVDVRRLVVTVREDGKTRVHDRFDVIAPASGTMPRINLVEGDLVTEGQVLARITPATLLLDARGRAQAEARVATAQARVRQIRAEISRGRTAHEEARSNLERQRLLHAKRAITPVMLERAQFAERARAEELRAVEFAVKVASHEVVQARAALGVGKANSTEWIDVKAPAAGRVLRVARRDAGLVAAGSRLLEIGDPTRLEVVVDVLTADAVKITPGAPVGVIEWGGEARLAAHVLRIEPSAFTRLSALGVSEQRVNAVIHFDEPADKLAVLGDGYRVEAEIILSDTEALSIPTSALFRRGGDWAVFRVVNGRARLMRVTLGKRTDRLVEIAEGLSSGDWVIARPGDRIEDGAQVRQ